MKVGVVGLGKLGFPLACVLSEAGHEVIGVDKAAVAGPLCEPHVEMMYSLHPFVASQDFGLLEGCEFVYVVVPTPSLEDGSFDISAVRGALRKVTEHIAEDTIAVIVSTINPGDMITLYPLRGNDCIVYSPLFIALGLVVKNIQCPDFVLIGSNNGDVDERFSKLVATYTQHLVRASSARVISVSPIEAEIIKLAVNCYVTMKITYANMIGEIATKAKADPVRVLDVVGQDWRVGTAYLSPGGPYAGPCFPRDNRAMSSFADKVGAFAPLLDTVDGMNLSRYISVLEALDAMSAEHGTGRVAVLGLAYKANTKVTDASLGTWLIEEMKRDMFEWDVVTFDPIVESNTLEECLQPGTIAVLANDDPCWKDLDLSMVHTIDVYGVRRK